ncbi:MAG: Rieske 2Fe-2S domain-containing protein [Thaumarchaeota archaeon]|nr:Rieske 2Fe-2S domain-containing protein [Nitrososphaerota archaeon]
MGKLVRVAEANEIEDGGSKVVQVDGKMLAIFRVKDQFFVLNNACLHRGGPLGEGDLDGYQITCPWHGWSYDVRTGAFGIIPPLKVKSYPARREGSSIMVELDE